MIVLSDKMSLPLNYLMHSKESIIKYLLLKRIKSNKSTIFSRFSKIIIKKYYLKFNYKYI
jgi:hypothetical protein